MPEGVNLIAVHVVNGHDRLASVRRAEGERVGFLAVDGGPLARQAGVSYVHSIPRLVGVGSVKGLSRPESQGYGETHHLLDPNVCLILQGLCKENVAAALILCAYVVFVCHARVLT